MFLLGVFVCVVVYYVTENVLAAHSSHTLVPHFVQFSHGGVIWHAAVLSWRQRAHGLRMALGGYVRHSLLYGRSLTDESRNCFNPTLLSFLDPSSNNVWRRRGRHYAAFSVTCVGIGMSLKCVGSSTLITSF